MMQMIYAAVLVSLQLGGAAGLEKKELSVADKTLIAVQEICPMSGEKLGAHGDPIKVKLGEEELFLCCQACMERTVDAKHWSTIHANFAEAQGTCLVMKKDLPEKSKWVIAEGRVFYVCCPPCSEKITADAKTFVDQLLAQYRKTLAERGIKIE